MGVKKYSKRKEFTVAELVTKAETLVDQCEPELALRFYEKALLKQPTNTALLDIIGELNTELDNLERAQAAFQKSIELAPAVNPCKWLYIAQLVPGEEAEKYTQEGIAYLQAELQHSADLQGEEACVIKKQISDAYCSLGELYMTDLCDEEDAETKCETCFLHAMNYDIGMPEPTQALANLRLTQQRKEEAIPLLEETYRRLNENCDENSMPSLEFRIVTGKLLIEVEKYEEACDVLESVLQEDDENAEIWFLIGTCYRAMDNLTISLEYFEKCEMTLTRLQKELGDEFHLEQQLESVVETIAALHESIKNRPDEEEEEEEEEEEKANTSEDVDMD